jgi:hypothetical protein
MGIEFNNNAQGKILREAYEKELKKNQDQGIREKNQQKQKPTRTVKRLAKKLPILSKISQIKSSDLVYGVALIAAALKDLLDIVEATGWGYFFVIILTLLIFIFIGFMMLLGIILGGGGSLKILFPLFGGTTVEMLFGLNLLPITMATVLSIYWIVLSKRKKNQEKMRKKQVSQEAYA